MPLDITTFTNKAFDGALSRVPTTLELETWTDSLRENRWRSEVDLLTDAKSRVHGLMTGAEYVALSTTNSAFVTDLFQAYLDRSPTTVEVTTWTTATTTTGRTATSTAMGATTEFADRVELMLPIRVAFEEVELDREYTGIATFGPKFQTSILGNWAATQQRFANLAEPIREGQINFEGSSRDQLLDLEEFFITKWGMAIGFRFFPPTDHEFRDDVLATVVGTETDFKLIRVYQSGSRTMTRRIVKPVEGSVQIYADGDPIDVTMNWENGRFIPVDSIASLTGAVLTARGEFNVPVFFGADWFNPSHDATFSDLTSLPLTEILPAQLGFE